MPRSRARSTAARACCTQRERLPLVSPASCTSSRYCLHDISEKYQRAVSLGKIADDDVTITQALLELGDVCARGRFRYGPPSRGGLRVSIT